MPSEISLLEQAAASLTELLQDRAWFAGAQADPKRGIIHVWVHTLSPISADWKILAADWKGFPLSVKAKGLKA